MRDVNKSSRLSGIQRMTLRLLLAIEQRGVTSAVPGTKLFGMVERNRTSSSYLSNYRKSCHTLVDRGLIERHRSPSLQLAFLLTDAGRLVAIEAETEAQELAQREAANGK